MRLWMGSELTRSEALRRSGIYPYIRIAPDARMRWGRFCFWKKVFVFCGMFFLDP